MEIVAELSAAFLGELYGLQPNIGNVKSYLEHYAGKGHVTFQIAKALNRVEEIYRFIKNKKHSELNAGQKTELDLFAQKCARSIYA
jgi:antirestriction protein ArdC